MPIVNCDLYELNSKLHDVDMEELLTLKMNELNKVNLEIQELGKKLKEASSSQKSKSNVVAIGGVDSSDDASPPSGASLISTVMDAGSVGVVFLLETRAYWLFGVAAFGIYCYGDLASI